MPQIRFTPDHQPAVRFTPETAMVPAPSPPAAPDIMGEFLSDAGRRTKALGSAILDTIPGSQQGTPFSPGRLPDAIRERAPFLSSVVENVPAMATTGPAGVTMQSGAKALVKASPAVQTAVAVKDVAKGGGQLVKGAVKAVADRPREPIKALTQALKPLSTNIEFSDAATRALPHLKAAEAQLGKSIETVADLREATKVARKQLWSEYEGILGPQAARGVDASPVAEAIVKSIPAKVRIQNPAAAKRIEELADTYRRTFTLGELDDMLTTSNAELASYYAKYPAAKGVAARGNPETAQNVAEADALRNLIYGHLDKSGAARQLKKIYGSIINVEKEAQRRLNVAARQNPESLSEQLGWWQAAMQIGRAAATFPVRPIGAIGDVAGAYAGRQAASAIREANSADALIANVFRNFHGKPTPIRALFPNVKGLLQSGPVVTPPPPDPSRVTAIPAEFARPTRLIPERAGGPFITPPPRDSLLDELRRRAGKPPKR